MKKGFTLSILMASLLLSACSSTGNIDSAYENQVSTETVNSMVAELDAKSDGTLNSSEESGKLEVSENTEASTAESGLNRGEPITDSEGHYLFNPFVKSETLSVLYPQEYWDTMFNMIDALRQGADSFKCASADAFAFAKDPSVWSEFFPSIYILFNAGDGKIFSYEDGVGKINYTMPKEEFLEKEKAFEEDIEGILRDSVKADYNDFEKALFLYDYVTKNFTYDDVMVGDFDEADAQALNLEDRFGTYNCFKNRSGICSGIGCAYVYLLHQCGVDSFTMNNVGGSHRWVYLKIDGVGYYSDPTWGIRADAETPMFLDYFLFSNARRGEDYPVDTYKAFIPDARGESLAVSEFYATDEKFDFWKYSSLERIDTEANVVTYTDAKGQTLDYQY